MTIRLIAGLGNDDRSYLQTFHNVGSRAVELFAERRRWNWREKKMYYAAGDGNLSLARSRSYMNVCGPHVAEALGGVAASRRPGVAASLLVVVDDFMLPEGKLRFRRGGSSGGHNGLKSIIETLGTEEFPRLRIGVGPVPPGVDPADYVLHRVSAARLDELAAKAADALEFCLAEDLEKAMNKINAA